MVRLDVDGNASEKQRKVEFSFNYDTAKGITRNVRACIVKNGVPVSEYNIKKIIIPAEKPTHNPPEIDYVCNNGQLTIIATGDGMVKLDVPKRASCEGQGRAQFVTTFDVLKGFTLEVRACIVEDKTPVSEYAHLKIDIPAEKPKPDPPKINHECKNGKLTIHATGNGIVRIEAKGKISEGQGHAEQVVPFDIYKGIKLEARACIVERKTPVSEYTIQQIDIPAEKPDSPKINLECKNGKLTIHATGNGMVRLEANGDSTEGQKRVKLVIPFGIYEGISLEARACIIQGKTPVSEYNIQQINIDPMEQPDEEMTQFEPPVINWDWNLNEDLKDFDGVAVVTATGDGFIMLEVSSENGDHVPRTGDDEAQCYYKCDIGNHVSARACIWKAGTPASEWTEKEFTIPAPNAPAIEEVASNGKLTIRATGTGRIKLEANNQGTTGIDRVESVIPYDVNKGITIEARACIIKGDKPLSEYAVKSINIEPKKKEKKPTPPKPNIDMDSNQPNSNAQDPMEAFLSKIKAWYEANGNKPLAPNDILDRLSKKHKSPKQRLQEDEIPLFDKLYKEHKQEAETYLSPKVTTPYIISMLNKEVTEKKTPSSSLILIVGISKVQQARLRTLGILDVAALLNRGRTPDNRKALASKLDLDVKLVNSWVKQADLWRVEGMTTDLAYLLVLAGIRNVEDLSRVDIKKVSPILKGICCAQADFSYGTADETRLESIIIKAGELVNCQSATVSMSEIRNQLSKILSDLPNEKLKAPDLNQLINTQLEKAMAMAGAQDLGSLLSYDEDPPRHLFKDEGNEMTAEELELLNGKNIKRGLDFLDDIQFTLPLPRKMRGHIAHKSKDSTSSPVAMPGVQVEVSGFVSPSDDKKECNENPCGITDGDGKFIIVLPEKYSMKEVITITVKNGNRQQDFVMNASDIIASVAAQKTLNMFYTLDRLGDEVDYLHDQSEAANKKIAALKSELERLKKDGSANGTNAADMESIEAEIERYTRLLEGNKKNDLEYKDEPGYEAKKSQKLKEYSRKRDELFDIITKSTGNKPGSVKEAFDFFLANSDEHIADVTGNGENGCLIVIDEIFNRERLDLTKALPSVKLMDNEEQAVRLSTDTAPSRIHKYSMLQRLVEPTITSGPRHSLVSPIDVMGFNKKMTENPNLYPQASSLGIGYILNMHQAWVPNGFALGDLLYSLVLAPGEEQRLIVRENKQAYTIQDDAQGLDATSEGMTVSQNDDTTAAFNYALNQLSQGNSEYNHSARAGSVGASLGVGFLGSASAMLGLSGGYSKLSGNGSSSSQQSNAHSEASSTAQSFQHSIKSASDKISQAKRISMQMASAETSESVATKIIANHNHSHAMTIQYWEVMRRYKLETCIDDVNLVLFVPLRLIRFLPENQHFYLKDTSGFDASAFSQRYDILLRYYDTLNYSIPYQYRSGLSLIKRFASYPSWTLEKAHTDSTSKSVFLTLKGNFMECDSISATLYLANGHGSVAGHCQILDAKPFKELIEENKVRSKKELLRQIEHYRSTHHSIALEITFSLPSNVSMADLASIRIQNSFMPVNYNLFMSTDNDGDFMFIGNDNGWSRSETQAVQNYLRKMNDLYEDDKSSGKDIKRINHYYQGLPENFIVNIIDNGAMLTRNEVSSASRVMIDSYTLTFGTDAVADSSLSSYSLNRSTAINITHAVPTMRYNELMKMEETLHHVASNPVRYSQAIWASLSDDERVMMLEQYTIDMNFDLLENMKSRNDYNNDLIPLLNCVNVKNMMGFYGNCMILPFTFPQRLAKKLGKTAADIQDSLYRFHTNNFRVPTTTISLPTQGMIGEAVLGETNVSEEIDITRFWNWQDSPIDKMAIDSAYLSGPDILKDKRTKDISALNISGAEQPNAVSIPDLVKELVSKQTPNFTDITGLDQLKDVLNNGTKSASEGRNQAIQASSDLAKAAINALVSEKKPKESSENKPKDDNGNKSKDADGNKAQGDNSNETEGGDESKGHPEMIVHSPPEGVKQPVGTTTPGGPTPAGDRTTTPEEPTPADEGTTPADGGTTTPEEPAPADGGTTTPEEPAPADGGTTTPEEPTPADEGTAPADEEPAPADGGTTTPEEPPFMGPPIPFSNAVLESAKYLSIGNGTELYSDSLPPYVDSITKLRGVSYYSGAVQESDSSNHDYYFLTINPYLDKDLSGQWDKDKEHSGFYRCRSLNMLGGILSTQPHISDTYFKKAIAALKDAGEDSHKYRFSWKCNIFVGDVLLLAFHRYSAQVNANLSFKDLVQRFIKARLMRNASKTSCVPRYKNASQWPSELKHYVPEIISKPEQIHDISSGSIIMFFTSDGKAEHLEIVTEVKPGSNNEFTILSLGSHWNGAYLKGYTIVARNGNLYESHDQSARRVEFYNLDDDTYKKIINK